MARRKATSTHTAHKTNRAAHKTKAAKTKTKRSVTLRHRKNVDLRGS